MKVMLRKVTKIPSDFEVKFQTVTFKGYLQYHEKKLILLKAKLSGLIEKSCDICAEDFTLKVDEDIEFFICDGLYEDDAEIALDVVESFDGFADIDALLHSEIELIRSDYHRCDSCEDKDEFEF